jgi:hypothetical protein
LTKKPEFFAYQEAIATLMTGLGDGNTPEELLILLTAVAEAARDLSEVIFPPPVANAGPDLPITATGDTAVVTLDASGSQAAQGNEIVRYRWEKE